MKRAALALSLVAGCCCTPAAGAAERRRFLQRQDDPHRGRHRRRLRLRRNGPRAATAPRQAHSRQSDGDRAEPARRRQHDHGQPARRQRPVRRHRDRRAVQRPADHPAAAADRRALRSGQDDVDRQHQSRNAGHLYVAHRAGEVVHRHRARPKWSPARRRPAPRNTTIRCSPMPCSITSSRSSPATRARRTSISRWSAARSTATARPTGPRCCRSTAIGSRKRKST